jgi:hypothetical protein
MPFLSGRGQAGRGMFGLGGIPGAPTFFNTATAVTPDNNQATVDFIAPDFNGRIIHYWIRVCLSYFC